MSRASQQQQEEDGCEDSPVVQPAYTVEEADDMEDGEEEAMSHRDSELDVTSGEEEDWMQVFRIKCKTCSSTLTERAQKVTLVADHEKQLFSTDLRTEMLQEFGLPYKIDSCDCLIKATSCAKCHASNRIGRDDKCLKQTDDQTATQAATDISAGNHSLGYHVVKPCDGCMLQGNNGHYWLFHNAEIFLAEEIPGCLWSMLNYNGSSWDKPRVFVPPAPAALVCPICSDVFHRPVVVRRCGHAFCQGCLMRELDRNGLCPLDRQPVPEQGGWAAADDLSAQESSLQMRCKYGCWRFHGDVWEDATKLHSSEHTGPNRPDLPRSWCMETVTLQTREQHEASCSYKDAWEEAFNRALAEARQLTARENAA